MATPPILMPGKFHGQKEPRELCSAWGLSPNTTEHTALNKNKALHRLKAWLNTCTIVLMKFSISQKPTIPAYDRYLFAPTVTGHSSPSLQNTNSIWRDLGLRAGTRPNEGPQLSWLLQHCKAFQRDQSVTAYSESITMIWCLGIDVLRLTSSYAALEWGWGVGAQVSGIRSLVRISVLTFLPRKVV